MGSALEGANVARLRCRVKRWADDLAAVAGDTDSEVDRLVAHHPLTAQAPAVVALAVVQLRGLGGVGLFADWLL